MSDDTAMLHELSELAEPIMDREYAYPVNCSECGDPAADRLENSDLFEFCLTATRRESPDGHVTLGTNVYCQECAPDSSFIATAEYAARGSGGRFVDEWAEIQKLTLRSQGVSDEDD